MIRRLIERLVDEASSGNTFLCITIQSREDNSKWLQMTWDHLNCAFPVQGDPESVLARRNIETPGSWTMVGYEPGKYVTWEHGSEPDMVAAFATQYAEQILDMAVNEEETIVVEEVH